MFASSQKIKHQSRRKIPRAKQERLTGKIKNGNAVMPKVNSKLYGGLSWQIKQPKHHEKRKSIMFERSNNFRLIVGWNGIVTT